MVEFTAPGQRPYIVEKRRVPRSKTFLGGKVVYGEGPIIGDCRIRSLSATGAKIELPEGGCIPEHLFLIPSSNALAYEAKISWIKRPHFGLSFMGTHHLNGVLPPRLEYLKKIWATIYLPIDGTPHELLSDRARRLR
jgi:hypothetical protein